MKIPLRIMSGIFLAVLCFVLSVSTLAQTTVFNENFEGTLQVTPSGVPAWSINTTLQVSGTNSYKNVVALNDSSMFITNVLDLTGYTYVILDFQHICKIEFFDAAEIFISVNNGTTWTKLTQSQYLGTAQFGTNGDKFTATSYPLLWLPSSHAEPPTNAWWMYEQFNISPLVSNQSQVRIKFKLRDGNGNGANANAGWFLDDIRVIASAYELIPPVIALNAPILQDTVYGAGPFNVSATITDGSGISQADLIFRIDSILWDTISMVNTSGNIYQAEIPGQPYNTVIDYYVRAIDASLSYNQAQTTVKTFINKKAPPVFTFGTGTTTNGTSEHPTPYGTYYKNHRVQYMLRASELTAMGVPPGPIMSVAFDVAALNTIVAMPNFAIKMKHTTATELTTTFESGTYTTVWTNANFLPVVGWNVHTFSTPFMWDGTSNLIIDICFDLIPGSYTQNASVRYTSTPGFNSATWWRSDTSPACGVTTGATTSTNRANIMITTPPNDNDYDAGVVQITEPTGVVLTSTPADVKVRIKNYGILTLTSVDIGWSINGVAQTTYPWTGSLLEDVTSGILTIGTGTFALGNNQLKVWTSLPNGQPDENTLNDTMTVNLFGCDNILNGNYTINPAQPTAGTNFNSFADAFQALSNCGVSGPVVFDVAPATYNTRLVFNGIFPGMSATNTVTFKGTTGTIIHHTTTVSDQRAAILLNGAKHLRFDSLTVNVPSSSTFGQGIQFINNSEDIQVTNCTINVDLSSTSTNYAGIVASGSLTSATTTGNSANNILLENNTVNGGYYGIIFYGNTSTALNNIQIMNNKVQNSYYYGIRTNYTNSVVIEGNTVTPRVTGGTTSNYAVYIAYEYQAFTFNKNRVLNSGLYAVYVTNATPASGRSEMINNEIAGFTSTGTPYGIYLTTCANIDILYNSINVDKGTGRGIYTVSSATGLRILNNSFVYSGTGAGYAAYHSVATSLIEHDYNNYYSSGTTFVYYGAARADLAALQAVGIPVNNDANSVSGDPLYLSTTMLMPIGGILNDVATPIATVTNDILDMPRDPSTPDIGAYEYTPVNDDLALIEAELVRGECLSSNDSLYVKVSNVIGNAVDFSVDPLTINWSINGPVSTNGLFTINTGTLALGSSITFGFDGMDLSLSGTYVLNVYLDASSTNLMPVNDTLYNAQTLTIDPYIFDAQPNSAFITTPLDTVELTVNSNMFPAGGFLITEVCHYKYSVGAPTAGWPAYLLADDYIEITGAPGSDLAGYTLEQWSTTALMSTHTFPQGTILSPNGTAIIAVGQMGSSVPSPANHYYHGNGAYTGSFDSSGSNGRLLKDPSNTIIDAVGYNTFTFPAAAGATPQDWSGNVPSATTTSGIRLIGPDINHASNWVVSSATYPQNPNQLNANVPVPTADSLSGFSWSLDGVITSVNSVDTVVGPWLTNGVYQYVASYQTPCGVFTDTVHITVFIPQFDLTVQTLIEPIGNDCYYLSEDVIIEIANLGIDTVPAGFTAGYFIDGSLPLIETVNQPVPPGEVIIHTFSTPLVVNFTGNDTTVILNTFVNFVSDPFDFNDTLTTSIKFYLTPDPPVVADQNIPYGTTATINAISSVNLMWYNDPPVNPIFVGNPFITPVLYDTTKYWVSAGITLMETFTFDTNLEGWTPSAPCTAPYAFVWDSDGGNGAAFIVDPSTTSGAALYSPVFNVNSDTTFLSFRHKYITEQCCDEGFVAYRLDGGAWTTFIPTTGAYNIASATINQNPLSSCISTSSQPAFAGNSNGYIVSSGNIITTGATTLEIAFVFNSDGSVAGTGWYIDEVNIEASGCASDLEDVIVYVYVPAVDAKVIEMLEPVDKLCADSLEYITVTLTNNGTVPVLPNELVASYVIDGGIPVNETLNLTINQYDTITFTFAVPFATGLTPLNTDAIFDIRVYINHANDAYNLNDTIDNLVKLLYKPVPPIAADVDIPYGTSTTLSVISGSTVMWYDNPAGSPINTGLTYTTPVLYDTTYYWVGAGLTLTETYTFDTDLEGWIPSAPCIAPYTFVWDSDGGTGTAFVTDPSTSSGSALYSPLYNINSDTTSLSFRHKYITESCCDEAFVAYRLNGGPWVTFVPTVGTYTTQTASINPNAIANCTGTSSQPAWSGSSNGYIISSGNIITTGASTLEIAFVFNSDGSVAGTGWYIDEVSIEAGGCVSDLVEIAVNVLNAPAVDVGPTQLVSPVSGFTLGSQIVRVKVQNFGTAPITNIPVSYKVNTGAPVTETITATIQPGDDYTHQFSVPYVFGAYGPYNFTVYTSLSTDLITVNDTLYQVVNNNQLIYCASAATSPASYGDIGNVTISNINNGIANPIMGNPNATGGYSDFTLTVPPIELAQGLTYPMSVTVISASTYYYTYYVKAFIDYDQDGVFDPVNELVFEGITQSITQTEITGNVVVPLTATSGYTRMRVVCVETSTPSAVQPCGTYTWGETEDYTVLVAPQLPQDGGVISIISPTGIYSEGDQVNVILEVRNYGTAPLTSIPLSYQHNANPPVLQTWTGNLAPNQTVQINMPPLTVETGANQICGITDIIDDTNTFNDQSCTSFWGMPGLVIFEDNFEGSSTFTTTDTVWQHGIPAGAVINSAFEGDSCWVTVLNGQYPSMATAYLVSPVFNFTGITDAYLSLSYWMDGEVNSDGGSVQYSTNNGINWTTLGVISDPDGYNWYDSYVGAQPGWSEPTNGWRSAFMSLSALDNAGSNVKLRFVFRSNATVENEGFAVDAVKIHVPMIATDAGVVEIVSPQGQTITGGANQVQVKIKNFGTSTLTSIPLSYKVAASPAVSATWTGTLNPDEETLFTFPQTFVGPFNPFTMCAYTTLTGDVYKFNDTICAALTPGQAAIDGGITDIISPTEMPGVGQNVQVIVEISNFGSNALSNFPVQFSVDGIVQTTEIVQTTLNPGATMNYTFVTPYTSQGQDIYLCAKTAIPSDAQTSNDQFCKDILVGINEIEASGIKLYQNIPNPAGEETVIGFSIPTAGKLTFTLTNVIGQSMMSNTTDYSAGMHSITLNTKDLAPGIYYYSIVFDQIKLTKKMIVE